jgi:Plasmid encoded RepA protein
MKRADDILAPLQQSLALTRAEETLVELAADLRLNPPTIAEAVFQHSVFCQVGLPRRKTDSLRFERTSGAVSILVKAGELRERGAWVQQPLPWGPKPRLILIYAISEALRNRSPVVSIGRTAAEFMARVGIEPQGSEYRAVNRQLKSLAACDIKIGIGYAGMDRTKPLPTFDHIDLLARNPHQQTLWTQEIEFTPQFFDSILEHAVPLAEAAIRGLRGSALALDVYTWLAHRLHRVGAKGARIRWEAIQAQFGQEYGTTRSFRQEFRATLNAVLQLYPDARVRSGRDGLILLQSPPPIPPRPVITVPQLPGRR